MIVRFVIQPGVYERWTDGVFQIAYCYDVSLVHGSDDETGRKIPRLLLNALVGHVKECCRQFLMDQHYADDPVSSGGKSRDEGAGRREQFGTA